MEEIEEKSVNSSVHTCSVISDPPHTKHAGRGASACEGCNSAPFRVNRRITYALGQKHCTRFRCSASVSPCSTVSIGRKEHVYIVLRGKQ